MKIPNQTTATGLSLILLIIGVCCLMGAAPSNIVDQGKQPIIQQPIEAGTTNWQGPEKTNTVATNLPTKLLSAEPHDAIVWVNKQQQLRLDTNGNLYVWSNLVGQIKGTNWQPVPDLKTINKAGDDAFSAGAIYGSAVVQRNPDVGRLGPQALVRLASELWKADQEQKGKR